MHCWLLMKKGNAVSSRLMLSTQTTTNFTISCFVEFYLTLLMKRFCLKKVDIFLVYLGTEASNPKTNVMFVINDPPNVVSPKIENFEKSPTIKILSL